MKTKQYTGKTREQAIEEARRELGEDVVIMYTKRKLGLLCSTYIVTAGVEDDVALPNYKEVFETAEQNMPQSMPQTIPPNIPQSIPDSNPQQILDNSPQGMPQNNLPNMPQNPPQTGRFDAVADDKVEIPVPEEIVPTPMSAMSALQTLAREKKTVDPQIGLSAEEFRSTFREVEQVISQTNAAETKESPLSATTYNRRASLVHYNDPVQSVEYTRNPSARQNRRRQNSPNTHSPAEQTAAPSENAFSTDTVEEEPRGEEEPVVEPKSNIVRAIYKVLLDHEVDERYINQVMAELDPAALNAVSIETALGLVYQKLVLKFGRSKLITFEERKPKVVFFVGPTGVGKTTTIAKLAADFRIYKKKKVALFTADTYRIAAEKQITDYGDLMQIDVVVLYIEGGDDINQKIAEKYSHYDLILVDTTGFSHRNREQRSSIKHFLDSLKDRYDKQVYLVLSATTKYRDLKEIVDVYSSFTDFDLLFTKLDETKIYGNILNIKLYADKPLSYVTTGQEVPGDFEVIDPQKMVRSLLGGG